MTYVDCYFCQCPVEWDPSGRAAEAGITLEECERRGYAVICNVCLGMAEVEVEVETVNYEEMKTLLSKDAA